MTHRRLEAALSGLFGPGVRSAIVRPGAPAPPFPGEGAGPRAVPLRRAEYAAGRHAARLALAALGHPPAAIPSGPDRGPVWPPGFVGSIAHHGGLALAALARGPGLVGLDIVPDAPLPPEVAAEIAGPGDEGAAEAVFAAKETVYKALAPAHGAVFGFDAAEVRLTGTGWEARLTRALPPFEAGLVLRGRLARAEGWILAGLHLPG
ncbi:4'-phosphopantetheinyl transferase family protein [Wenxinia saemankumensis]|uniref:4'-phosphopantetheinyl transferase EntD (Siderophore biosynthesis) n=1 Tax=Wenxinia saemankumensis TaxID=1447782 RepID=A0A1M6FZB8_9RHOB|nr:hypothetical protein [Wenxinia saemankumensis]SHJ03078.1 4'-phosphopantetheinyl transferase EntD (siderophore biosynthesis) [Wenxinia saemankumensis]